MAYNAFTLHSAASADANGPSLDCEGYSVMACQITGTFTTAVVYWEGTVDGSTWVSLEAINVATGAKATSAAAAGVYRMGIGGLLYARGRLDWTSGTSITVTARVSDAADAMIQDLVLSAGSAAIGKLAANSGVDIGDVDVLSIAAGETHLGEVGCNTTVVSVTPAITAGAYTALDIVGAIQTIANATRVSGEPTILQSITVTDLGKQNVELTIFFFNANPGTGTYTDNIALTIHDTDMALCVGVVQVLAADYRSASASSVATVANIGLPLMPAATSLFAIAQASSAAPTYASTSDLTLRYAFLRD